MPRRHFSFFGLKDQKENLFRDAAVTAVVLVVSILIGWLLQFTLNVNGLTTDVFLLGVFMIAVMTQSLFWPIFAAIIGVLTYNFIFSEPYFAFNFYIAENITSAVIMLMVGIFTSAITRKLRLYERKTAEAEKERMRADLLRAVSHDLRTPLTTIYGASSAILEHADALGKKRTIELVSQIQEDSKWLIRMVENLLSVTRIDSEHVSLTKTDTVLDELIDSVLVKFRRRYPAWNVEVSLPDEIVMIPMDTILIEQVLMNLLENAVLHAKGMKTLSLLVSVKGRDALFEVSDDGCGIAESKLERLFTMSPDEDETPTDGKRNMGIGLSVCAAIIRAHGGKIWAKNRPGGGASFFFILRTEAEEHERESL